MAGLSLAHHRVRNPDFHDIKTRAIATKRAPFEQVYILLTEFGGHNLSQQYNARKNKGPSNERFTNNSQQNPTSFVMSV
jgi:hypothetical protein